MAGFWSKLFGAGDESRAKSGGDDPDVADDYRAMRDQLLRMDAGSSPDGLTAVVMETGYPEAVVMLSVLADGTIRLCHSQGGSLQGLEEHDGPREAARRLWEAAVASRQACAPAKDFPMPDDGHTRFCFVTADGVRTGEGTEDDLVMGRHALSPLYQAAQVVLTECRRIDDARGKAPPPDPR